MGSVARQVMAASPIHADEPAAVNASHHESATTRVLGGPEPGSTATTTAVHQPPLQRHPPPLPVKRAPEAQRRAAPADPQARRRQAHHLQAGRAPPASCTGTIPSAPRARRGRAGTAGREHVEQPLPPLPGCAAAFPATHTDTPRAAPLQIAPEHHHPDRPRPRSTPSTPTEWSIPLKLGGLGGRSR